MKIYVVKAHGGQYEDSWTYSVKAFTNKEKAQSFISILEKEDEDWLQKANKILSEFGDNSKSFDIEMAILDLTLFYSIDELDLEN